MINNFKSSLGPRIKDFFEYKRQLGFVYSSQEYLAHNLDCFISVYFGDAKILTKEIVDSWLESEEKQFACGTMNLRFSFLRQLGQFLAMTDGESYILPSSYRARIERKPDARILTYEEIKLIFDTVDAFSSKLPLVDLSISVIVRLLYATGIRPGEICRLKRSDYSSINSCFCLHIAKSKSYCGRYIPLSDELSNMMNRYLKATSDMPSDSFLFSKSFTTNDPLTTDLILERIRAACKIAGISKPYPRTYDFRHTYITLRIMQWYQDNENLKSKLFYLKTFVGHEHLTDTFYYFKFTPQVLSSFNASQSALERLIPEVIDNED